VAGTADGMELRVASAPVMPLLGAPVVTHGNASFISTVVVKQLALR
jgi:hypothetical protein